MRDDRYWDDVYHARAKQRLAEQYFIFDAQPLVHWLDPGYEYEDCETEFTDQRDGKTYQSVCIGEQIWMAENLNYAATGACYDGNPNSCATFGRLYTWIELTGGLSSDVVPSGVQGICPEGWHVPSMAEWEELIEFAGGQSEAGRRLKANSPLWVGGSPNTDDFGFAALPAGQCDSDGDCYNEDDEANFWTSSVYGPDAPRHIFIQGIDYLGINSAFDNSRFSCRCVKDE
jgi:uncharacterized protein (TIGR02145 family)